MWEPKPRRQNDQVLHAAFITKTRRPCLQEIEVPKMSKVPKLSKAERMVPKRKNALNPLNLLNPLTRSSTQFLNVFVSSLINSNILALVSLKEELRTIS